MAGKRSRLVVLAAAIVGCYASATYAQTSILSPSDFIIAVDRGAPGVVSSSPGGGGEDAVKLLDGDLNSKYLNFGKLETGFIVTPGAPSIIKSFVLGTGNDAPERDPASYQLFGTNSPILSTNHSGGSAESWTLISSGGLSLTDTRSTLTPAVNVANDASYSSYKMIFNTVKNAAAANSMQLGEARFFSQPDGNGPNILASNNPIIAVANPTFQSRYPGAESPSKGIDGVKSGNNKYLNFGKEESGLIITPASGPSVVRGLRITTANDAPGRDPASFEIYGTNDTITSPDNSQGTLENWTLIKADVLSLPGDPAVNFDQRGVEGAIVAFANETQYKSYKIIFPENKADTGDADSIQFTEIELFSQVPEPGTAGLAVAGALLGLAKRRRKA
jgi:hypothetical protein